MLPASRYLRRLTSLLTVACAAAGCSSSTVEAPLTPAGPASFVGRESCATCHAQESELWAGSHHDMAMQVPADGTVAGDFANRDATLDGERVRFYRDAERFLIDVGDATHEVAYTFGAEPLQQYLVDVGSGRLQPFGLAWDARSRPEGGQRWFDLYPDDRFEPGDDLHWTGLQQNWNYTCSECHSTGVERNWIAAEQRYDTRWAEIDVSCEACHGPASNHVAWAAPDASSSVDYGAFRGFEISLARGPAEWPIDATTGLATRVPATGPAPQVESCGQCHARRTPQSPYEFGKALSDTHRIALLDSTLYWPDGQPREETYVYGSFAQSKMFAAGVACADCHEPHSGELVAQGNALCNQCHLAATFDAPEHTFHDAGTPGAQCVDCHMPETTFMQVDARREHAFRVPRPDLSAAAGVPNACSSCHTNRPASWAAGQIEQWYGGQRAPEMTALVAALSAASNNEPGGADRLVRVADDRNQSGIARATALSLLNRYPSPRALESIQRGLNNDDPLVRSGALMALRQAEPEIRLPLAYQALRDRNRTVRLQAARLVADAPLGQLSAVERDSVLAAVRELESSLRFNADRPEFQMNLGVILAQTGRGAEAEAAYREALRLAPQSIPPRVNLADIYRTQGRDAEGEVLLREAVALEPDNAGVHHALGLLLVRRGRMDAALDELDRAWRLQPGNPRMGIGYALTLESRGDLASATQVMRESLRVAPNSVEILSHLVRLSRGVGDLDAARGYVATLLQLAPQDPTIRQWAVELAAPGER